MRFDENVPKKLPQEATLIPNKQISRLSEELTNLRLELQCKYRALKGAPAADRERYTQIQNEQRAARQKQNRKALKELVRAYFVQANYELLSKEAHGVSQSDLPT